MLKQLVIGLSTLLISMAGPSLGPRAVDAGENPEPVMSSALGVERDLPWSEPVQINDPFEGEFVGVFDRHFFSKRLLNTTVRVEIQSLWTRNFIRVLSTVRDVDCFGYSAGRVISPNCSEFSNPRNITQLLIKVNDEILTLYRQGSTFPISESVAIALKNAPEEVISIRLISETGEIIDSEIGKGTVAAWKVVYGAGAIADSPASLQGGF